MKWRFHRNWRGKQILQIEHKKPINSYGDYKYFWKDASADESVEFVVEIKLLKELSSKEFNQLISATEN